VERARALEALAAEPKPEATLQKLSIEAARIISEMPEITRAA
jgi:predicted glycosyltransferase